MQVFTIEAGRVTLGATVETLTLAGAGVTIPVIIIGEEGRNRQREILPVALLPDQDREWKDSGTTTVRSAILTATRAGKPKLAATTDETPQDQAVVVFRTGIGYRGGNDHTGDRALTVYFLESFNQLDALKVGVPHQQTYSQEDVDRWGPLLAHDAFVSRLVFHPFPGHALAQGVIAQGDAGRMGAGNQVIATIPAGVVFRTSYSGRLYGSPAAHYYIYQGGNILSATWNDRQAVDLF